MGNQVLTVGEDEPKNAKGCSNPGGTELLFVSSNVVQNRGPIFTGKDLVHANEGVVDVEERYPNCVSATVCFGNFPAK